VAGFNAPPDTWFSPVPEALRKEWRLSSSDKKHVDLQGFPLLSSEKVSDAALQEAAYLITPRLP